MMEEAVSAPMTERVQAVWSVDGTVALFHMVKCMYMCVKVWERVCVCVCVCVKVWAVLNYTEAKSSRYNEAQGFKHKHLTYTQPLKHVILLLKHLVSFLIV